MPEQMRAFSKPQERVRRRTDAHFGGCGPWGRDWHVELVNLSDCASHREEPHLARTENRDSHSRVSSCR